jgi:hypothetical protein
VKILGWRRAAVFAFVVVASMLSMPALPSGASPTEEAAQVARGHAALFTSRVAPPPQVVVDRRSAATAPGLIFIAPKASGAQGPEIIDDRGRPVWFHPLPGGQEADDFRVQTYNGKPVLTWWPAPLPRRPYTSLLTCQCFARKLSRSRSSPASAAAFVG